jgi:hypothetical protein
MVPTNHDCSKHVFAACCESAGTLFQKGCMRIHIKWAPGHHGMVRSQLVDGDTASRVVAIILNKRSTRGGPRASGLGGGARNPLP